ncbi:MAG: SRPBCC family protein, partial [Hyphomonadaceae bacterium]|nr:SRPBCC family protein [Hyphomonadaceae bacterium]
MAWMIGAAAMALAAVIAAVLRTPRTVEYVETVVVGAPARTVFDAIRFQERLMLWSAWPSTTKSTCACEGVDGVVGARTVFFSKGKRFGHQEVTRLIDGRAVELSLQSAGPPQKPRIRFDLVPLSDGETEVRLHFRNEIERPFNVILRLFGVVAWTREMHRKDLQGLKRYVEPPHLTYVGDPAPR